MQNNNEEMKTKNNENFNLNKKTNSFSDINVDNICNNQNDDCNTAYFNNTIHKNDAYNYNYTDIDFKNNSMKSRSNKYPFNSKDRYVNVSNSNLSNSNNHNILTFHKGEKNINLLDSNLSNLNDSKCENVKNIYYSNEKSINYISNQNIEKFIENSLNETNKIESKMINISKYESLLSYQEN